MNRRLAFLSLLMSIAGCDPGVFDSIEERASTRALSAPEGYVRDAFGVGLATVAAPVTDDAAVSRIMAVGGPNQPLALYSLWTGSEPSISLHRATCDDVGECPQGTGTAVAGISSWAGQGACFVVTSPALAETRILCESGETSLMAPDETLADAELGHSVAGVSVAGSAVGVAILGAPGEDGGAGALYRLEDGAAVHTRIALPVDVILRAGDRLGTQLATFALLTDTAATSLVAPILVAATAEGRDRVFLIALGGDNGEESELLGCVDGAPGFGGALALGDLTGDGEPELVVGQSAGAANRADAAHVYSLAGFVGGAGCGAPDTSDDPAVELVTCPTELGVECAGSGFGSALAIGDVNADMLGDLLVGAPSATVGDATEAGAAFLFSGNVGGVGGPVSDEVDLLVDSNAKANAHAGAAVAMAASHLGVSAPTRMEPVISAPGARKLLVFLCTDLEQIASLADQRCLELD